MKRLVLLTMVAVVTATFTGCGCCGGWFRRGPHCEVCPPTTQCAPGGPAVLPGAAGETYLPAPG